jgi:protein Jumonji
MGVTVPTLNVGMVFTAGCWYRDPHGLPWVEYHHTGAPKVWYSVPESHSIAFYTAMKQLVPAFCRKKKIWLPADTAMVSFPHVILISHVAKGNKYNMDSRQVPPNLLVKHGVSVCRAVQEPGEFVIVFPRAYTSYVCTGYAVSESVYFAPRDYLGTAEDEFK